MTHRIAADPQVHLHWVRETPSRGLDLPVSSTLQTLDALPPCARAAIRATGLDTVELHLPPYRPLAAPYLNAWFASLSFRQDAAGRLVATHADDPDPLATMALHQAIVLALRAVSGDTTPFTVVAEAPPVSLLRRPLAIRHQCAPRGGLAAAPAERTRQYYRVYRSISRALQTSIREIVPPAHINGIDQFADRLHIMPLLTWSAAEPVLGLRVDELGIDVFNREMLDKAFRGLPARLAARLTEVREILHRHRAAPFLRTCYQPKEAARIASHCRRQARFLNLLFMNEFRLILGLVKFCARIEEWRNDGAADPAAVYRSVRDAWEEVEVLIRRFYQRRRHSALGSLLLLEAVRVLEAVD